MLVIRLRRIGKKNKPSYRMVVAEQSMPVDGRFVEDLGFYNPHTKTVGLNKEKTLDWLKKGAQPSNTISRILEKEKIKHKLVTVVKYHKKPKKSEEKVAKPEVTQSSGNNQQSDESVIEEPEAESAVISSGETPAVSEETSVVESTETVPTNSK
jgi:small subunit ribosomal protein S16